MWVFQSLAGGHLMGTIHCTELVLGADRAPFFGCQASKELRKAAQAQCRALFLLPMFW